MKWLGKICDLEARLYNIVKSLYIISLENKVLNEKLMVDVERRVEERYFNELWNQREMSHIGQ